MRTWQWIIVSWYILLLLLNLWYLLDAAGYKILLMQKMRIIIIIIDYTTTTGVKWEDLNIKNGINNITVIEIKPYVANTTNSFILSSLQLTAALCNFIVQVVTINSIIVSTTLLSLQHLWHLHLYQVRNTIVIIDIVHMKVCLH